MSAAKRIAVLCVVLLAALGCGNALAQSGAGSSAPVFELPAIAPEKRGAFDEGSQFGRDQNGRVVPNTATPAVVGAGPINGAANNGSTAPAQPADTRAASEAAIATCRDARARGDTTTTYDGQSCEAILATTTSAQERQRITHDRNDPMFTRSAAISDDPRATVGGLTTNTTACTTRTVTTQYARSEPQSCDRTYTKSFGTCTKTLDVSVHYRCSPPTTGPQTGPSGEQLCKSELASCPPGTVGPNPPRADDPSASGPTCRVPASGAELPATVVSSFVPAEAQVSERWVGDCATFDARVPSGLLPADGDNALTYPVSESALVSNESCFRTGSNNLSGAQTRIIDGVAVTRPAWGYANEYVCLAPSGVDECTGTQLSRCTATSAETCIDRDTQTGLCLEWRTALSCPLQGTASGTIADCSGKQVCTQGVCFDAGHPPDSDFARAVTMSEVARQAGRYTNGNFTVFDGVASRCSRRSFGLNNCCSGQDRFANLSNNALAGGAMGGAMTGGGAMAGGGAAGTGGGGASGASSGIGAGQGQSSLYAFDGLFTDSKGSIAGAVLPGAAGVLGGGNLAVPDFLQAYAPDPAKAFQAMVESMGLESCSTEDKTTVLRTSQRVCVDLGEYCERRRFGVCQRRTRSYCCFNSILARILNEQGRPQLGKAWGDARNPDCSGFTVEQIQSLDFSRIDFTEFYETIQARTVTAADLRPAVEPRVDCIAAGTCANGASDAPPPRDSGANTQGAPATPPPTSSNRVN